MVMWCYKIGTKEKRRESETIEGKKQMKKSTYSFDVYMKILSFALMPKLSLSQTWYAYVWNHLKYVFFAHISTMMKKEKRLFDWLIFMREKQPYSVAIICLLLEIHHFNPIIYHRKTSSNTTNRYGGEYVKGISDHEAKYLPSIIGSSQRNIIYAQMRLWKPSRGH